MFKDIHVGTLSPAYRQGIKERHVTNPTATYGELALRNLVRTPLAAATTLGFLTGAALLVGHDVWTSGILDKISHGQEPGYFANPQQFAINYLEKTALNDKFALGLAVMSVPTAVTTVLSAGGTVFRGIEFGISGVQTLNKMRTAKNAGIADD